MRADFKSDRHAALSQEYPPEVTHCGDLPRRAWMPVQPAVEGPFTLTLRQRLRRRIARDVLHAMPTKKQRALPRPHTLTWRTRLTRALRSIARNFRSPL
jgi:hypothetical protein